MDLDHYLEKIDNGESIRYREIADNDPQGAIELLENSSVNKIDNKIEVDPTYAANELVGNNSNPLDSIENIISTVLDGQYEAGFQSAEQKMREINNNYNDNKARELTKKKSDKNDKITKMADTVAAGSGLGFLGSAALGSVNGMGASATAGILSSAASARFQGARDRSVIEAADGLIDAYGNMDVELS